MIFVDFFQFSHEINLKLPENQVREEFQIWLK